MTISFITSNQLKFKIASSVFNSFGIELDQVKLDVPEIQASQNEPIATFSAQFAFEKLQKPLIVTDVGFYIPALNGFPGPYIKYLNETLSPTHLINLLKDESDRRIIIKETVGYCNEQGQIICFNEETVCTLGHKPKGVGNAVDQIMIMPGFTEPIGLIDEATKIEYFSHNLGHYKKLGEYLIQ